MAIPSFESLTTGLDRITLDCVGETIQYAANGTTYASVQAIVNYRDAAKAFEAAEVISQDVTVTVLKVDVPVKPTGSVRLTLPRISSTTFKPLNARTDDSGTGWEFEVKEAVSA